MAIGLVVLLLVLLDSSQKGALGKVGKIALGVLAVLCGVSLIMNVPFLYELVGVRIEGMLNGFMETGGDVDSSAKTRMNLVKYGMSWFAERPAFGFGGDNFRALMSMYYPKETAYYAHNNYVEMLVSYGLVGTIVYYTMPVILLLKGLRYHRRLFLPYLILLCLVICMLVMDYGMVEYYSRNSQMFIALVWAAFAMIPKSGCVPTEARAFERLVHNDEQIT
jgi:O-antigen ligase